MKIAIPTVNGVLCPHFGHCQEFALVNVDDEKKTIEDVTMVSPPNHEPGVLPQWLAQQGANLVISGGMGQRAIALFNQANIKVISGAAPQKPEEVVNAFLNDTLQTDNNLCDH